MAKPIHTTSLSFVHLTVMDELMNVSDSVNTSIRTLCDIAKPPLDAACLLFVCRGAERAFGAAMATLHKPNAHAISVHAQLKELTIACQTIYAKRELVDIYTTMKRRLRANPGWAVLAKLGSMDPTACDGIAAAIGVNVGLAWAGKKLMALTYLHSLRQLLPSEDTSATELLSDLARRVELGDENWSKQLSKFLPEFWALYDTENHPPPPQKTIAQKAKSEWNGRAAFPSYRRRAAVLDKTCLSLSQIAKACEWTPISGFNKWQEYQIAEWLIGFSGLYVESVHRIPIVGQQSDPLDGDWAVQYDLATGLLLRDYTSLATGSATTEGRISEPASYIIALPAPQHLADYIYAKCLGPTSIQNFGDLIPQLRQLTPEGTMYTSLEELKPSWARWNRSVGPYMRQLGIDNFLTGIMIGDLGMTAKSKLHYARVQAKEIWAVSELIYTNLNLGVPVAMPSNQIGFGSQVAPSSIAIQEIDSANVARLGELWPGKRCGIDKDVAFHNVYVIALGFRFMVRFSLRAAASFPISAAVDEGTDATVDVIEKSSAERKGGIAALITGTARNEIGLYRAHCRALLQRLKNHGQDNTATQWLASVINQEDFPLLQLLQVDGATEVISTGKILDQVCSRYRLAEDFGRKWNENAMRLAGSRTSDIDRMLRHEVAGQEATTTLSDCSEETWIHRTKTLIEPLHHSLFSTKLRGLRKE